MKTIKNSLLAGIILFSLFHSTAVSSHRVMNVKGNLTKLDMQVNQVISYLSTCSHHHTTSWCNPIPGSSNYQAGIEGGGTATVYVSGSQIIGHTDASGGSPNL